ncbi:uncharacterized protein VTP21DRAFT_3778 [Calcarisporiella thermophila]|uniref:uncharacterized protein n=1 Tax=Calcarisporiella thermophila TaxID=911321 RepID=UPI003742B989
MAEPDSSRLEQYLLLSKSARGAACVQLIKDALAAPGVYVFAELLEMPNVAELEQNREFAPWHTLLKIFSYGTYKDYKDNVGILPELDASQLTKLKHLSIVTLAEKTRTIPYDLLLGYFDIPNVRALEDLIITGFYAGVFSGKLDQQKSQLELSSTMGRDLRPNQITQMLEVLSRWSEQTDRVIRAIDDKCAYVMETMTQSRREKEAYEKELERVRQEYRQASASGTPGDVEMTGGSAGDPAHFDSVEYSAENMRRMKRRLGGFTRR